LIEEDFYGVIWTSAHKLAEAQFEPAKDFFILGLEDSDWVWRESCVSFLGFHFSLNEIALEKIRNLLLNDTSPHVRMAAASVLGGRSALPDYALNKATALDVDPDVRKAAYESILRLAGVSPQSI
jgi:HEAT repeat protein